MIFRHAAFHSEYSLFFKNVFATIERSVAKGIIAVVYSGYLVGRGGHV